MTRTLFALALVACHMDAEVGRQDLAVSDAMAPVPDGSSGARRLFSGAWHAITVHDARLIALGSAEPDGGTAVRGIFELHADGKPEPIVAIEALSLAIDAANYYAADFTSIVQIDKQTLAHVPIHSGPHSIETIAVDGQWLYILEKRTRHDDYGTSQPDSRLVRLRKDGTGRRDLLAGLDAPVGLALDDRFVYVAEDLGGRIHAAPKTGCPPIVLASNVNRPSHVTVVRDWVYFTERGNTLTDGAIARVRRPTQPCAAYQAEPPERLTTGLGHPSHVLADDTHVYWSGYFSGIQRAPLEGGPADSLYDCWGRQHDGTLQPTLVQGCGAFALLGAEVFFAARDPGNSGTVFAGAR